jgi:hypothetical protein
MRSNKRPLGPLGRIGSLIEVAVNRVEDLLHATLISPQIHAQERGFSMYTDKIHQNRLP